jgi:hypothetical protein
VPVAILGSKIGSWSISSLLITIILYIIVYIVVGIVKIIIGKETEQNI